MEGVAENLVELSKIKEGRIMNENTDEEKQTARENIKKRIRQQFDYQKRNMNDRFNNLGDFSDIISISDWLKYSTLFSAELENWKNQIAKQYGIDFDDELTQI